jgi:aldehyde dehydrogenase (NAD+)
MFPPVEYARPVSSSDIDSAALNFRDLQRLFELQKDRVSRLAASTASERIAKLERLRRAIEVSRDEILAAVHADFRKSPAEALLTEIFVVTTEIAVARRYLKRWMKPRRVPARLSYLGASGEIRVEPKGVALILSPWNFPFQLAVGPLVSAIAAGNCAILKPSEFTPNTSTVLKKFLGGVFPEDEVAVVEGDAREAQALLELPFDHIFFTGSTAVGRIVLSAAAKHLSSVTLELGGKCPAILDETADLKEAAKKIAWGKFLNAGQTCVAPDYVVVPHARVEAFVLEMKRAIANLYGPPEKIASNPDYCRLVNARQFEAVRKLVEDAVAAGARVVAGGEVDARDNFMAPTLVTGVERGSPLLQKEIFGPVLPILTSRGRDEAVEIVNSLAPPLAVYIFSRDRAFVESALARMPSGGALVNDVVTQFCHPDLPFGGVRESGLGRSHGEAGFREFSRERAVLRQPKWTAMGPLYPPYTPVTKKLLELAVRFLSGR